MKRLKVKDLEHLRSQVEKLLGVPFDIWADQFTQFINEFSHEEKKWCIEAIAGRGWYNNYSLVEDEHRFLQVGACWIREGMEDPLMKYTGPIVHRNLIHKDGTHEGHNHAAHTAQDMLIEMVEYCKSDPQGIMIQYSDLLPVKKMDFIELPDVSNLESPSKELLSKVRYLIHKNGGDIETYGLINLMEIGHELKNQTIYSRLNLTKMVLDDKIDPEDAYGWSHAATFYSDKEFCRVDAMTFMGSGIKITHKDMAYTMNWVWVNPDTNKIEDSTGRQWEWNEFWNDYPAEHGWKTFIDENRVANNKLRFMSEWSWKLYTGQFNIQIKEGRVENVGN